jgi:pimeloyl-ACP methyl ester carboxylesterase
LDQTLIIKGLSNNSIDWGKIILSGHSFGGAAAFELAARDRRISSLLLFDPWFYPLSEELINNADIEATIFCINSESFRKRKEA